MVLLLVAAVVVYRMKSAHEAKQPVLDNRSTVNPIFARENGGIGISNPAYTNVRTSELQSSRGGSGSGSHGETIVYDAGATSTTHTNDAVMYVQSLQSPMLYASRC